MRILKTSGFFPRCSLVFLLLFPALSFSTKAPLHGGDDPIEIHLFYLFDQTSITPADSVEQSEWITKKMIDVENGFDTSDILDRPGIGRCGAEITLADLFFVIKAPEIYTDVKTCEIIFETGQSFPLKRNDDSHLMSARHYFVLPFREIHLFVAQRGAERPPLGSPFRVPGSPLAERWLHAHTAQRRIPHERSEWGTSYYPKKSSCPQINAD